MKTFIQVEDYYIEFDAETHQYWVDHVPVISVTQLIKEILPSPYKRVDPTVLARAAERGTELHDAIEHFEETGEISHLTEFKNYLKLKKQHQIDVVKNEQIVVISHLGVVIAAGRFDMIVTSPFMKGQGIVDVKRMAHLHQTHLSLQLNLYKLGYEQTYKTPISYLKCIHLRGHHYEYVDIMFDKALLQRSLNKYVDLHPELFIT
ncbi:MAG: hypothetical protein O2987_04385 [Firmicutes bacterium]|nr:hypothetical protein [Bacillota bacterium]